MTDRFNPLAEIADGEYLHHEFKRKIDNPESIAGEIVAFANSEGGVLYIGIEDDGGIVGLEDSETVFRTLAKSVGIAAFRLSARFLNSIHLRIRRLLF